MSGDSVRLILTLSTSGAKSELGTLNISLKATETAVKGVETASKASAKSFDTFKQGAQGATAAGAGLAAALSTVSPEAAQLATVLSHVSNGFAAVTKFGVGALGILGPVAVAVGALALAYREFKADLDEANKKMEDSAKAATKMSEALDKVAASRTRAEVAIGVNTGRFSPETTDLNAITNQLSTERAGMRADLESKALSAAKTARSGPSVLSSEGVANEQALRDAKARLKAFDDEIANTAAALFESQQAAEANAKAEKDRAAAIRASTKAANEKVDYNEWYGPQPTGGGHPNVTNAGTVDSGELANLTVSRVGVGDLGGGATIVAPGARSLGTVGGQSAENNLAEEQAQENLHQKRMGQIQGEAQMVMQMAQIVSDMASDIENLTSSSDDSEKKHPNSLGNWIRGGLAAATIAAGILTVDPALVVAGVGQGVSLASDIKDQRAASGHAAGYYQGARQMATGGYSDRATSVVLHAGERVITGSAAGSQTARVSNQVGSARDWSGTGASGGTTVNFHGPVIGSVQALLDAMDQHIGTGAGYSRSIAGKTY